MKFLRKLSTHEDPVSAMKRFGTSDVVLLPDTDLQETMELRLLLWL